MNLLLNILQGIQDFIFFRTPLKSLVKQEERPLLILMGSISFFLLGIPRIFTGVTAQTLFLNRYGAESLPWVYITLALTIPLTGWLHLKLKARYPFTKALQIWVAILTIGPLVLVYLLVTVLGKWPTFLALIWFEVEWVMGSMIFWEFAGHIFNLRQSKRLYGLIGAGEVLALIVAGLLVSPFLELMETSYLILFSSLGAAIGWVLIHQLLTKHLDESYSSDDKFEAAKPRPAQELFKERYIQLIFFTMTFSMIIYYFVDNAFFEQAQSQYVYPPELAGFLGFFMAIIGLFTLAIRSWFANFSFNRIGVIGSLLILPVLVLLGALMVSTIGILQGATALLFWLMCSTRFMERVFHQSLFRMAAMKLYDPFSSNERGHIQTLAENIVERFAGGVAGLLLLIITFLLEPTAIELSFFIGGIALIWIGGIFILRKQYLLNLENALRRHGLSGMSLDALSNISILKKMLEEASPTEIMYALRALEKHEAEDLLEYLEKYLKSEFEVVRCEVIDIIRRNEIKKMFLPLVDLLEQDPSLRVKSEILRTIPLIDTSSDLTIFNRVLKHLDNESPQLRKGTLIGLLQGGGLTGSVAAGEYLNNLIVSEQPEDRKFVCEVLEEAGISNYYHALIELLRDPEVSVVKAAIRSAAALKHENLWPLVVETLKVSALRLPAMKALVSGGDATLPHIEPAFRDPNQPKAVIACLARVCGQLKSKESFELLLEHLEYPNQDIRHQVYLALAKRGYHVPKIQQKTTEHMIKAEVEDTAWTYTAIRDLGDHSAMALLVDALKDEISQNIERIFLLLGFLYSFEDIKPIMKHLNSGFPENKEIALSSLEKLLSKPLKTLILPLLIEQTEEERLKHLTQAHRLESASRERRLHDILAYSDSWVSPWTKSCALHAVGTLKQASLSNMVIEGLHGDDPVQRESAIWALAQCKPQILAEHVVPMLQDAEAIVANAAKFVLESVTMMGYLRAPGYTYTLTANESILFTEILFNESEPQSRRVRAAQMLGSIASSEQQDLLLRALKLPDEMIRSQVLQGIKSNPQGISNEVETGIIELVNVETQDIAQTLAAFRDLKREKSGVDKLLEALQEELIQNRSRLFSLLQILQGDPEIATFEHWVVHSPQKSFPQKIRLHIQQLLHPYKDQEGHFWMESLLTELNTNTLIKKMANHLPAPISREEWLQQIVFSLDFSVRSWTKVQGLYCIIEQGIQGFNEEISKLVKDSDPLIRETAIWGLSQLAPPLFYEQAGGLLKDPNPKIVELTTTLLNVAKP